jgi:hypothetical protein
MDCFHVFHIREEKMKKIVGIVGLTLLFALAAFADQDAQVQPGYAIVTPSAGAAPGLVVFETFGMRGGPEGGTVEAGVLPAGLTTNALLFVDASGRLSKNLGVAIVNPNTSDLTVTMTLLKSDGTQVATADVPVKSHQQVSKFVTQLFPATTPIPSDFTGTLTLTSGGTSPLPFSAIGLRFRGPNFSTVPVTSLATPTTGLPSFSTGIGGDGAVLLPQFATGGGWATEIVIGNSGASALTVRVDLFKPDGTPLSATLNNQTGSSFPNLSIPAHGVLVLAPRNAQGDDDF